MVYMKHKKRWFAAKSYFEITVSGKPIVVDSDFNRSVVQYEERIVLFFARNVEFAINEAKKEARKYCNYTYKNIYGLKVTTKFIGLGDIFELYDDPTTGTEIYSENFVTNKSIKKSYFFNKGELNSSKEKKLRKNLLNREFNKSLVEKLNKKSK